MTASSMLSLICILLGLYVSHACKYVEYTLQKIRYPIDVCTSGKYMFKCEATSDTDSTLIPFRYSYSDIECIEGESDTGTSTISLGYGSEYDCTSDSNCAYAVSKGYQGTRDFNDGVTTCIDISETPSSLQAAVVDVCVSGRIFSCTEEEFNTEAFEDSNCAGTALTSDPIAAGCNINTGVNIKITCAQGNRVDIMVALIVGLLLSILF
mmetsp:Transcript_54465/g.49019  ORF Transcript_54465/g.49019 Transcript_54465/m.49019 type:complete len:209 (-) Transcript_54465:58-684(-)